MMCFVSALPFILVSWILRVAIIDKLEMSEDIFRKVALSDVFFKITHSVCMVIAESTLDKLLLAHNLLCTL